MFILTYFSFWAPEFISEVIVGTIAHKVLAASDWYRQFNSLSNLLSHIVRRRTCLIHTRSSVRSVHLLFSVTRLPNCACCFISASNSPSSAASRNLSSVPATSASLASSMAFLRIFYSMLLDIFSIRLLWHFGYRYQRVRSINSSKRILIHFR